jgi:hypothetical protein
MTHLSCVVGRLRLLRQRHPGQGVWMRSPSVLLAPSARCTHRHTILCDGGAETTKLFNGGQTGLGRRAPLCHFSATTPFKGSTKVKANPGCFRDPIPIDNSFRWPILSATPVGMSSELGLEIVLSGSHNRHWQLKRHKRRNIGRSGLAPHFCFWLRVERKTLLKE